jgi:DNA phosphorothioation-dependent restriction protein DptH
MDIAELYYNKILSLFVETYRNEIATAQPGHCMKVTGFSLNRLQELLKLIQEIETDTQTYILSETDFGDDYVSPSKLIELRNDLSIPLLVLIPINSRTSAEDSYGNATFKELSVRHLDDSLFRQLLSSLPDEIKSIVNEIFDYFKDSISLSEKINYLLFWRQMIMKRRQLEKGFICYA